MLVILKENVANLGRVGDVVRVANGFARNFLLPRQLVAIANEQNLAQVEHQKRVLDKKRVAARSEIEGVAAKLKGKSISLIRKVSEGEKLFGSVTQNDIMDELVKDGIGVDKRSIIIAEPIRYTGNFNVEIRLAADLVTSIKVSVKKEA